MSAYGSGKSSDTDFRRKWDRAEYIERAKQRENRDRLAEKNEERRRMGLAPIREKKDNNEQLESLKMRDDRIDFDSNIGKIQVVQGGSSGEASRQPGFYCKACDIVVKDSANYLDHINGRKHQRNVGVQMKVERSSVDSVKDRLAMLKRKKEEPEEEYDLDQRIASLKQQEEEERQKRRERKRQKKEARKKKHDKEDEPTAEEDDMAKLMGFSGFGSTKAE
ncbi:hypothetical protein K492DRAFT_159557 [Lichtheimia hyalospora FSU 10163]|nr:hypothetical protein K492DRAFT_159557 [Lichtheimia hyalospora FSU 10163]